MDNETIKTKLRFFKDKNLAVHIVRNDGKFFNGKVLEVEGDLLILDDEKLEAMPITFLEIVSVEKREEKR